MKNIPFCNSVDQVKLDSFESAWPFPHLVIDNFYPESKLQLILEEVNSLPYDLWRPYNSVNSRKKACDDFNAFGPATYALYQQLTSPEFVMFLKKTTKIKGLTADKKIGTALGNVGCVEQTGYLNIHADYNFAKSLKLYRRLNLLLYLNKDWQEEFGGSLELWNPEKTAKLSYLPLFNRCIIFATSDISFHGHPTPINHPSSESRKSISLYYYSEYRGNNTSKKMHSTLYQDMA